MTITTMTSSTTGGSRIPGVRLHLDEEGFDFYIEVEAGAEVREWELAVSTAEALGYALIPEWRDEFTFPDDDEHEATRFHLIPKESSGNTDD